MDYPQERKENTRRALEGLMQEERLITKVSFDEFSMGGRNGALIVPPEHCDEMVRRIQEVAQEKYGCQVPVITTVATLEGKTKGLFKKTTETLPVALIGFKDKTRSILDDTIDINFTYATKMLMVASKELFTEYPGKKKAKHFDYQGPDYHESADEIGYMTRDGVMQRVRALFEKEKAKNRSEVVFDNPDARGGHGESEEQRRSAPDSGEVKIP